MPNPWTSKSKVWQKIPLKCKNLLVRSHFSGHIWKRVWVGPKGSIATGGEIFASLLRHYQFKTAKVIITPTLVITFTLVIALAAWAVIKSERERKAKKLFPPLLFELGQTSFDEVAAMIKVEEQKGHKDRVRILALKSVLEAKRIHDKPEKSDHFWMGVSFEAIGIFAVLVALLYALTLIMPSLTLHIGAIGIITSVIVFVRLLYRQD